MTKSIKWRSLLVYSAEVRYLQLTEAESKRQGLSNAVVYWYYYSAIVGYLQMTGADSK